MKHEKRKHFLGTEHFLTKVVGGLTFTVGFVEVDYVVKKMDRSRLYLADRLRELRTNLRRMIDETRRKGTLQEVEAEAGEGVAGLPHEEDCREGDNTNHILL
jgi:hypothetical protein